MQTPVLQTVVNVDGFNLYYAIRRSGCKWLDLHKLATNVLPAGHTIKAIHYYTARVSGAVDPDAPRRQQLYLTALSTIPRMSIHFGTFLAKINGVPFSTCLLLIAPCA